MSHYELSYVESFTLLKEHVWSQKDHSKLILEVKFYPSDSGVSQTLPERVIVGRSALCQRTGVGRKKYKNIDSHPELQVGPLEVGTEVYFECDLPPKT